MKFKNAIFDLDMTLIDSIGPLMVSANLVAEEFGLEPVTYEAVYQAEISVPNCTFEGLWRGLWGRYDPLWYEAYVDHIKDAEYRAMELYPGGLETLKALRDRQIPTGLASNRDYPGAALKAMGIEDYFQAVVGVLEVENPKPQPDVIIKCLQLLKANPSETLYVCDSKGDLLAAGAAGTPAFSLTTGGHPAEEMTALGAFKTGRNLMEILGLF